MKVEAKRVCDFHPIEIAITVENYEEANRIGLFFFQDMADKIFTHPVAVKIHESLVDFTNNHSEIAKKLDAANNSFMREK